MSDENIANLDTETPVEGNSKPEDIQEVPTDDQVNTSKETKTNSSEVGIQKKETPEEVETEESFSKELGTLVDLALSDKLTPEQRKSIDDEGLGSYFDMIIGGHKAQIEKNDQEIFEVVGSKEAYKELQEWASTNLNDSEIASFNNAVMESGDVGLAKLAVEGLQARYQRLNGSAPQKRIESGGTANESSRPYSNRDEYIRETMSIKYRQNPEYAAQVEAKRNVSGF